MPSDESPGVSGAASPPRSSPDSTPLMCLRRGWGMPTSWTFRGILSRYVRFATSAITTETDRFLVIYWPW